jgi:4-phospho-D-threonate 3-dehydrogenase / 4-phospho-D-erythronate 3-dehydrogenase
VPTETHPLARIVVTLGDPGGVGPEVIAKALADPELRGRAHFRVLGPAAAFEAAAGRAGIAPYWRMAEPGDPRSIEAVPGVVLLDHPCPTAVARPDRVQGEVSFRLVEEAIAAARRPAGDPLHADAIVTGPISKSAWSMAGHGQYPGHTELLAVRLGARRHAMMFQSSRLRVILATGHIPLMEVGRALSTARILECVELGHEACQRLGVPEPRIAVCGLNPHAGERGMLGAEDQEVIEPAVRAAAARGIDARGPFPGDTIFNAAVRGGYDLVVAMYHDQGLIPVKLLAWDEAVNVTVGLPTVRTSPDHGTAFDIAGQNRASPGSMHAALELAVRMSGTRG